MALVFVIMYVFICGFGGFLFVCLLLRSSIKTKNKCHEERKLVIDKINEAMRAFSVGDYVYRTLGSNSHFYYRIESIVFGRYEEKFSLFNSKVELVVKPRMDVTPLGYSGYFEEETLNLCAKKREMVELHEHNYMNRLDSDIFLFWGIVNTDELRIADRLHKISKEELDKVPYKRI